MLSLDEDVKSLNKRNYNILISLTLKVNKTKTDLWKSLECIIINFNLSIFISDLDQIKSIC